MYRLRGGVAVKRGKYEKVTPFALPKKRITTLLCIVVLLCAGVSATLAYFAMSASPVINTFQSGSVGAIIEEQLEGNTKKSITVRNSGDSPVFIRVRLISYWTSGENIAPTDSGTVSFTIGEGWKPIGAYYYYTEPVAGGSATGNLLGSAIAMETGQVIEVLADTVQATPAEAVQEVWNVSLIDITG